MNQDTKSAGPGGIEPPTIGLEGRGEHEQERDVAGAVPQGAERSGMEALLDELRALAHKVETQDNAATSDPYYTVQQLVRDYGIEDGFGVDGTEWVLDGECADVEELDDAERSRAYEVNYRVRWEHVQAFLTQEAAHAFMRREAHNYGPMRTWVESACRNPEMRWLRALPGRLITALTAEVTP